MILSPFFGKDEVWLSLEDMANRCGAYAAVIDQVNLVKPGENSTTLVCTLKEGVEPFDDGVPAEAAFPLFSTAATALGGDTLFTKVPGSPYYGTMNGAE
jgi:hypothetical protein